MVYKEVTNKHEFAMLYKELISVLFDGIDSELRLKIYEEVGENLNIFDHPVNNVFKIHILT